MWMWGIQPAFPPPQVENLTIIMAQFLKSSIKALCNHRLTAETIATSFPDILPTIDRLIDDYAKACDVYLEMLQSGKASQSHMLSIMQKTQKEIYSTIQQVIERRRRVTERPLR